MTIEFYCPHCNKALRTGDEKAGRLVKCPECENTITVPQGSVPQGSAKPIELMPEDQDFSGGRSAPPPLRASAPIPLDAGEVISTSWAIYKSQFGALFGATLILILLVGIALLPSILIQIGLQQHAFDRDQQGLMIFLLFAFRLPAVIFQLYMAAGQTLFFLKIARGQRADFADLFRGGHYLLRLLGSSLLFGLMYIFGLALLIIPGIIVLLMFWPFVYVLIDTDAPGIECLSRARQITPHTWLAVFLIWLMSLVIYFLGFLACGVGIFFAIPLILLMTAVTYCRMTGQPTALERGAITT